MKIESLEKYRRSDRVGVRATVAWEDSEHADQHLHVEVPVEFGSDLNATAEAFLLSTFVPAMCYGEQRIRLEGHLCPKLRNGVDTAMKILRSWYGEKNHRLLSIEATDGFQVSRPCTQERTASFMSGGVDSFATLCCNRRDFPRDHAESIRDCLFVYGFDVGGYADADGREDNFELAVRQIRGACEKADASLIPVYTNLRFLERDSQPYSNTVFTLKSHGAALAAIAHFLSSRITRVLIPSSYNVLNLTPYGSHPILDYNYSSSELQVQHDAARYKRLEKVGIICDWEAAMQSLRVCVDPLRPADRLNCGQCEKCLRTMVELLLYGKLDQCPTLPGDDVRPEVLMKVPFHIDVAWRHMIEPLRQLGRDDLARVAEVKLKEMKKRSRLLRFKESVKVVDEMMLRGKVQQIYRRLKRGP